MTLLVIAVAMTPVIHAHGGRAWGIQPIEWKNEQIDRVIALGHSGRKADIEGKECLSGSVLGFNVRDDHAFNLDETVWLDVDFYLASQEQTLGVTYDRSDMAPIQDWSAAGQIHLPAGVGARWSRQSIPLKRARFANLGVLGTDFTIFASHSDRREPPAFTLCNVAIRRTYTTPVPKTISGVALEVLDETGLPTPARIGIYDASGRLQLPSDEAIPLQSLGGMRRAITLGPGTSPWPAKNRFVFYVDGHYHASLPVGDYELVISKGLEYRVAKERFSVRANEKRNIEVKLRRWTDMAANSWYSGEDHIHYSRESDADDYHLQLFTEAEDLRVANILHMGNIASTYFPQHDWAAHSAGSKSPFVLVPGQEDPRTDHLGHTIQLNIKGPIRVPDHYLLYHEVFEKAHSQGGLAGYAHVAPEDPSCTVVKPECAVVRGMALDVPFGLVDFAEILSLNFVGGPIWFDFLNLGYKLSPAAGTDYPWGQVPGTVRNYVKVDQPFTPQAWFDQLKQGRTFVTSGPMVEFSINGQGMGSEVPIRHGEPLKVAAQASLNPDLGQLSSIELIEQGEPLKVISSEKGAPEIRLHLEISANHGTWFVIRARGKNGSIVALTAPIYVLVDGNSFWKPSEVPSIVAKLKGAVRGILGPRTPEGTEPWETQEVDAKYWDIEQPLLKDRVAEAVARYDALVKRAASLRQP
jgi:hypothetical protein